MIWNISKGVLSTQRKRTKVTAFMAAFLLTISSLASALAPFVQQQVSAAASGDVWVTAAMPQPASGGTQYVTVKNNTANLIDLNGWKIDDGAGHTITATSSLGAGDEVTICETPAVNPSCSAGYTITAMALGMGDTITLKDSSDNQIDQVSYTAGQVTQGSEVAFSHTPPATVPEITNIDAYFRKDIYKGISVDIHVDKLTDATGVEIKVDRANGGSVIKTNKSTGGVLGTLNTGNPAVTTAPIVIQQGTYNEAGSSSWNQPTATWDNTTVPTSITVTITRSGGASLVQTIPISQVTTPFATLAEVMPVSPTPSTNGINKINGWAHVNEISKTENSVKLEFKNPRSHVSCFEYRTDGDTSQLLATNGGNNYNTEITDGLYPYYCLNNNSSTETINANEYVEVRMVFGGEKDERFNWTRFNVAPDTTKPTISVTPNVPLTVSGTRAFDITVTDNQPLDPSKNKSIWVELYGYPDQSHKKGQKVNLSSGTGTFTVNTTSLPDGQYTLRVGSVQDAAGNYSGDKTFKYFTIDNTTPVLTNFSLSDILINSTDGNPTLTGDITDALSNIDSVKYAIWKEAGGNPKGSVARNWTDLPAADGSFDSKVEAINQIINLNSLNDGNYTLGIRGWDSAGNKGSGGDLTFVIDRTASTVSNVVLNGESVNIARDQNCGPTDFNLVSGKVNLSATIADDLSGVNNAKYKIRKVTDSGCTQTGIYQSGTVNMNNPSADNWITLPGGELDTNNVPADGNYTIMMAVTDNAGNTTTKYVDINVDNTAPVAPTLRSPGNGVPINGTSPIANDWDGVADADHYIYQSYNVDGSGNCILSPARFTGTYTDSQTNSRTLPDGLKFCWRVKAVDAAGNESGWSQTWKTIADNTAPVLTITNETRNSNGTYTITGTTDDPADVIVSIDGTPFAPVTPVGNDWTVITGVLAAGSYVVTATSTDAAGNTTSPEQSDNFTVPNSSSTTSGRGLFNAGAVTGAQNPAPTILNNLAAVFGAGINANGGAAGNNNQSVLGAQTDKSDSENKNESNKSDKSVLGDSTDKDSCSKLLGICWYYWVPIVVVIAGIVYYFFRHRQNSEV